MLKEKKTIKVVVLGAANAGLTCFVYYCLNNCFLYGTGVTKCSNSNTKIVEIENQTISFEIQDTNGRKSYWPLNKILLQNADVIILVYDSSQKSSFDELKYYWNSGIKNNITKKNIIKK